MCEDGNEGFRLGGQQSGDVNQQQGRQGRAGHHPGAGQQELLSLLGAVMAAASEAGALVQAPPGLCGPEPLLSSVAWAWRGALPGELRPPLPQSPES